MCVLPGALTTQQLPALLLRMAVICYDMLWKCLYQERVSRTLHMSKSAVFKSTSSRLLVNTLIYYVKILWSWLEGSSCIISKLNFIFHRKTLSPKIFHKHCKLFIYLIGDSGLDIQDISPILWQLAWLLKETEQHWVETHNHLQVVHRPFHWQANKEEDIMYNKLINRLVTDYFIYVMGVLCHA